MTDVKRQFGVLGGAATRLKVVDGATPQPFDAPVLKGIKGHTQHGTATTRSHTESGNADRLFDLYGEVLRYVPELHNWIYFDDGAWHGDDSGAKVMELAAGLARIIYAEGAQFDETQFHILLTGRRKANPSTPSPRPFHCYPIKAAFAYRLHL